MSGGVVTPGKAASHWLQKLLFADLKDDQRFTLEAEKTCGPLAPILIMHMATKDAILEPEEIKNLKRSIHQLMRIIKYKNVIICARTTLNWKDFLQEFQISYPHISFYVNINSTDLEPPHTDVTKLYFYLGNIMLHFSIKIEVDDQTGVNYYSEDPNDPTKNPWNIPPSSYTPTVVRWNLPMPTDMADATDSLVSRALYIRSFMERSRGDIRQWSWLWESEVENIQFVSSFHMEQRFLQKSNEIGTRFQVVFHGTDERTNVDSILQSGFDRKRVKRIRRGFSPAWSSSSFDKAFSFARKPGAVLMNRLLLGNTWLDNSRMDVAAPHNTKLCTVDSTYPTGHSSLPPPHYLQLGPREEDQVLTFAVITFKMAEDLDLQEVSQLILEEA